MRKLFWCFGLLLFSACVPTPLNTPDILPTDPAMPIADSPQPTSEDSVPEVQALPPDPIRVEFTTEDDVPLVGYFYPAAQVPAPVIVLMHWAEGDQTDWTRAGVVSWLQNRGVSPVSTDKKLMFDTPYPFKPLPTGDSYAVFTFDFRGFGESGFSGEWKKHILDAKAAYKTAASQPGVNPNKVFGIGASIGADAVVDGCEQCAGAISLSPGDYLDTPYRDASEEVTSRGIPVMCVAAENDLTAFYKCKDLEFPGFSKHIYSTGGHAMKLFRESEEIEPGIDLLIAEFLTEALK